MPTELSYSRVFTSTLLAIEEGTGAVVKVKSTAKRKVWASTAYCDESATISLRNNWEPRNDSYFDCSLFHLYIHHSKRPTFVLKISNISITIEIKRHQLTLGLFRNQKLVSANHLRNYWFVSRKFRLETKKDRKNKTYPRRNLSHRRNWPANKRKQIKFDVDRIKMFVVLFFRKKKHQINRELLYATVNVFRTETPDQVLSSRDQILEPREKKKFHLPLLSYPPKRTTRQRTSFKTSHRRT